MNPRMHSKEDFNTVQEEIKDSTLKDYKDWINRCVEKWKRQTCVRTPELCLRLPSQTSFQKGLNPHRAAKPVHRREGQATRVS